MYGPADPADYPFPAGKPYATLGLWGTRRFPDAGGSRNLGLFAQVPTDEGGYLRTNLRVPNRADMQFAVVVHRGELTVRTECPADVIAHYALVWLLGDVDDAGPDTEIAIAGGVLPQSGVVTFDCAMPVLIRPRAFFDVACVLDVPGEATVRLEGNIVRLFEEDPEEGEKDGKILPLPQPPGK